MQLLNVTGTRVKKSAPDTHYPTSLRFGDSSSNKFQRAALLKFGTHYFHVPEAFHVFLNSISL
jgi:hypothetical protein